MINKYPRSVFFPVRATVLTNRETPMKEHGVLLVAWRTWRWMLYIRENADGTLDTRWQEYDPLDEKVVEFMSTVLKEPTGHRFRHPFTLFGEPHTFKAYTGGVYTDPRQTIVKIQSFLGSPKPDACYMFRYTADHPVLKPFQKRLNMWWLSDKRSLGPKLRGLFQSKTLEQSGVITYPHGFLPQWTGKRVQRQVVLPLFDEVLDFEVIPNDVAIAANGLANWDTWVTALKS